MPGGTGEEHLLIGWLLVGVISVALVTLLFSDPRFFKAADNSSTKPCDQEKGFLQMPSGNCLPKYVLWKHNENMSDYREMTSDETLARMPEISKLYELNQGFIPYEKRIDVEECQHCTADDKIWALNGCFLQAGFDKLYSDNPYLSKTTKYAEASLEDKHRTSCISSMSTGICRICQQTNFCLKNSIDFDDVYFYPHHRCNKDRPDTKIFYAIFILNNQPVLERKAVECSEIDGFNNFVLWKHKEKLIGYREMNSTELRGFLQVGIFLIFSPEQG